MGRKYVVTAQVVREKGGWTSSHGVPTFFLDEDIQNIVSEDHAEKIAKSIIDPYDQYEVHACAILESKTIC